MFEVKDELFMLPSMLIAEAAVVIADVFIRTSASAARAKRHRMQV
jgi:hypothetical protein